MTAVDVCVCGLKLRSGEVGLCWSCTSKLKRDAEAALAEEQAMARWEARYGAGATVSVDTRTCECCLRPSSFSPCAQCERGDLGLLRHGDQPW